MISSMICGGSLNTIWAGGALRDMEVEVTCGRAGGWSSTTRSPWSRRRGSSSYSTSPRGRVCGREAPRRGGSFLKKNSERMFPKSESEMSADLFFVFE